MEMFIYHIQRCVDGSVLSVYVNSWEFVLKVISSLHGTDDSVSVTRVKVVDKFD